MKPAKYILVSALIFGASLLGWWILFSLPDRPLLLDSERIHWFIGLVLVLPTLPLFLLAALVLPSTGAPNDGLWALLGITFVSSIMWSFLIGLISWNRKRTNAQPAAAPNGDPAAPLGKFGSH